MPDMRLSLLFSAVSMSTRSIISDWWLDVDAEAEVEADPPPLPAPAPAPFEDPSPLDVPRWWRWWSERPPEEPGARLPRFS